MNTGRYLMNLGCVFLLAPLMVLFFTITYREGKKIWPLLSNITKYLLIVCLIGISILFLGVIMWIIEL